MIKILILLALQIFIWKSLPYPKNDPGVSLAKMLTGVAFYTTKAENLKK